MTGAEPYLLAAGLGLQAVSMGTQYQASKTQQRAQEAQMQAQAEAAKFNQEVALQNAEISRQNTEAQVAQADRERRLRLGTSLNSAGNLTGSVLDSLMSNSAQETLNILDIKRTGLLQERQYLNEAKLSGANAQNTLSQIPLVKAAGSASRASDLLSGASSLATTSSKISF